jgi:preprotein translocase subunit SecB
VLSPLQLKQHSLLEISVKEREACKAEASQMWIPDVPEVTSTIAYSLDDPKQFRITFSVLSRPVSEEQDQTIPAWDFVVRLIGYFVFEDRSVEDEKARSLTFVNGSSILYGIARDLLHGLTLRGQKPAILLPSLNFQPWADNILKAVDPAQLEAQESETESVKKAAKKPTAKGKAKS